MLPKEMYYSIMVQKVNFSTCTLKRTVLKKKRDRNVELYMKTSKSKLKDHGEPSGEGKALKRKMLQTPPNNGSPEIQKDGSLKKKVDSELKPAQMSQTHVLPDIQDVHQTGADSELKMTKEKIPGPIDKYSDLEPVPGPIDKYSDLDPVPGPIDKYSDLDPGLKDLVLKATKTKGGRVCRPPNAFMLFAKENRATVGARNPTMINGEKSLILGAMWRSLTDEGRQKYYNIANALYKLHKETYPDYTYHRLRDARKQKRDKLETKLRKKALKKTEPRFSSSETCDDDLRTPTSKEKKSNYEIKQSFTNEVKQSDSCNIKIEDQNETKCHYEIKKDSNPNNPKKTLLLRFTKLNASENSSNENLKLNVESQEPGLKTSSQINKDGMKKGKSFIAPKQPLAQRPVNLWNKPTHRYMPYYKSVEHRMPMTGYPEPCMHCPLHGTDGKYVEHNLTNLPMKENIASSSNHTYLPATHNSYFHPYRPLYNNAFYPSVFNPWIVWPGYNYNQLPYGYSNKNWMNYGRQASSDYLNVPMASSVNKRKLSSTDTEYPAEVESSTAFGGLLKDHRMMKNAVESSTGFGAPLNYQIPKRLHVESSTAVECPLKDPRIKKNGVEASTVFSGPFEDQRMKKNAVESSTAFEDSLKDQRINKNVLESSTVFSCQFKDQHLKKNAVESPINLSGPAQNDVEPSIVFDVPLKDQLKNKNVFEPQAAATSKTFEDGSEDDEFEPLVIDIDEDNMQ